MIFSWNVHWITTIFDSFICQITRNIFDCESLICASDVMYVNTSLSPECIYILVKLSINSGSSMPIVVPDNSFRFVTFYCR
jgi:hypothetical protein